MKTLLTNTITIAEVILAAIFLLAFSACSKESSPKCEKWEVEDVGTIINNTGCGITLDCGRKTLQLSFCGDDLKDASAGNTILLSEDDCCRKTRTFIRLIH